MWQYVRLWSAQAVYEIPTIVSYIHTILGDFDIQWIVHQPQVFKPMHCAEILGFSLKNMSSFLSSAFMLFAHPFPLLALRCCRLNWNLSCSLTSFRWRFLTAAYHLASSGVNWRQGPHQWAEKYLAQVTRGHPHEDSIHGFVGRDFPWMKPKMPTE